MIGLSVRPACGSSRVITVNRNNNIQQHRIGLHCVSSRRQTDSHSLSTVACSLTRHVHCTFRLQYIVTVGYTHVVCIRTTGLEERNNDLEALTAAESDT